MSLPSHYSPTSRLRHPGGQLALDVIHGVPWARPEYGTGYADSWWTLRWTTPTTWSTAISTRAPTAADHPRRTDGRQFGFMYWDSPGNDPRPTSERRRLPASTGRLRVPAGRPHDDPDVLVRGRVIVIGVDPGAMDGHRSPRRQHPPRTPHTPQRGELFPVELQWLRLVTDAVENFIRVYNADLLAVEGVTRPNWHVGKGVVPPPTRQPSSLPLGSPVRCKGACYRLHSGGQCAAGKARQGTYGLLPEALVSDAERRKPDWRTRVGENNCGTHELRGASAQARLLARQAGWHERRPTPTPQANRQTRLVLLAAQRRASQDHPPSGAVVTAASTASDYRALKNVRAAIERVSGPLVQTRPRPLQDRAPCLPRAAPRRAARTAVAEGASNGTGARRVRARTQAQLADQINELRETG